MSAARSDNRWTAAVGMTCGIWGVGLGVVLGKSPALFAWVVYASMIAVTAVAFVSVVVHELRERGRLRHPVIDQVRPGPPTTSARRSRADALDVIVGPAGPFTRVGTKR
jgi:hypothetical protein